MGAGIRNTGAMSSALVRTILLVKLSTASNYSSSSIVASASSVVESFRPQRPLPPQRL
jgi:hypothetical protein